jgi:hypothetical protein
VTSYPAPKFHHVAGSQSVYAGRSRSEPTAADASTKLTTGAGLIVALLVSLGLWAAIWLSVSSLR